MNITSVLIYSVIGGGTGWLAGAAMKNARSGVIGDIFIGCISGAAGGYLFSSPPVGGNFIGSIVISAISAWIMIWGARQLTKTKPSLIYFKGDELWIRRKPPNRR